MQPDSLKREASERIKAEQFNSTQESPLALRHERPHTLFHVLTVSLALPPYSISVA